MYVHLECMSVRQVHKGVNRAQKKVPDSLEIQLQIVVRTRCESQEANTVPLEGHKEQRKVHAEPSLQPP